MSSKRILGDGGHLEFRRILPCNIETLWRFLVEDELRAKWLCHGEVEPFAGGKIEFKFDPENFGQARPSGMSKDKFRAEFVGKIVAYEPPNKLTFSWPGEDESSSTLVSINLKTVSKGTSFHLIHENLSNTGHVVGAAAGWHAHLEQLDCHLSRKLGPNFWQRHEELELDYRRQSKEPEPFMPDHWKTGRGKMGFMHPLLGKWEAVDPDTPLGKVVCIRTYEKILDGKFIRLEANWDVDNGKKTYDEIAHYGLNREKMPAFWSFTSDGGQSTGVLADVATMNAGARGFEAQMPSGLARFGFWPTESGMVWAAEAKSKKGWLSMIHHDCKRI